jgi:LuxR family maltose regulon positive regulatory protein
MENRRMAREKLEEAWEISRSNGFDMPFVELGDDMRLLSSEIKYLKSQIPPEWLESLRSRAAAYGKMILAAADHGPEILQSGGTILLRRETAVLRALSQGLTRGEIARREGISLNAVKETIKNLYKKLGAVNRADAMRIALASGLLKNSRH